MGAGKPGVNVKTGLGYVVLKQEWTVNRDVWRDSVCSKLLTLA